MANVEEKVLEIKVRYDDAISAIAKYQGAIDAARLKEADLKKQLKENQISRREYNAEMAATKVVIQENNEAIRVLNKEIQNNRKYEELQEGSLKSLRAELSNLTAEYDSLSRAERNGAKGQELKKHINDITDELKTAEEETQRFYRNVGNYTEAIIQANQAQIPFYNEIIGGMSVLKSINKYFGDVKSELLIIIEGYKAGTVQAKTFSGAQKAAAITSNLFSAALKVLKLALISTGIGAIVVLLGSLVAWLAKTQKGTEVLSNIMSSFGAIINVIIDRVAKFGGALVKIFSGDFSGGAKEMKEAFSGIGEEIANDAKQAWELNDALQQLDKMEVMLSMRRSANKAQIEELKKISEDTTKSADERLKAIEKAYNMEQKDLELQTQVAEQRLANTLGYTEMNDEVRKLISSIKEGDVSADEMISKLGLSESTIEDLREFREQFNALQELQESSYTRQTEQQNKINTIKKEASDYAKSLRDKELAEIRKAEDELLKLVKDGREKQSQEIKLQYDRQIEDLRARLNTETDLTAKARSSINQQISALEQQKNQELQKLSDEELQKELDNRQKLISLQLESVKEGSEQEYQLKMQQLFAARDSELAEKELTEQMKLAIVAKYNKQIDDLSAQHETEILQKQKDAIRLRYETEIAQAYGNEQEILRIKLEQKQAELDAIQQLEGESTEAFNLRKIEMQNEYLSMKQELANKEIEIEQAKYEAAASITNGLSGLFDSLGEDNKEFAVLSKTLALAEIAINTGKAIAAGTAQAMSVPFPANLAAIATTISTVLSNIATAINTVKSAKFATGGLVTGPGSETSDSIPAQLSNGESVLTAAATSMFAPMLSAFNQMGGGIPINVTATSNQALGEDMLARAVAKGVMMAPAPIVSIEEFTSVANRVKYVENLGNV